MLMQIINMIVSHIPTRVIVRETRAFSLEAATENKIDIAPPRATREKGFRNKWLFKFHRCTQFLYQLSRLALRNWIPRRAFIVCDIQDRDFYSVDVDK